MSLHFKVNLLSFVLTMLSSIAAVVLITIVPRIRTLNCLAICNRLFHLKLKIFQTITFAHLNPVHPVAEGKLQTITCQTNHERGFLPQPEYILSRY